MAETLVGVSDWLYTTSFVTAVPPPMAIDVLTVSVVDVMATGVPVPIAAPGLAQSPPSIWSAFRLATFVVEAIVSGAVPVETVDVMTPDADSVVNAPAAGAVEPSDAGDAQSEPSSKSAFRLLTFVVEVTTSGAVPMATVEISCDAVVILPLVEMVVMPLNAPANVTVPAMSRFWQNKSHL